MQFNKYLWELYKKTKSYKKYTETANSLKSFNTLCYSYTAIYKYKTKEDKKVDEKFIKDLYCFFQDVNFTLENTEEKFLQLIDSGIDVKDFGDIFINPNSPLEWCSHYLNSFITQIMYSVFPEFFFIYFFNYNDGMDFKMLTDIFEYFEIPLPKIPSKKDKTDRALYYVKLCKTLYEFRKLHGLSEEELYAFLYGYAYDVIMSNKNEEDEALPSPSKAWYAGNCNGNWAVERKETELIGDWQSNENMKLGDIVVMYYGAPYSCIHSIFRAAKNDVFIDPFYYYYRVGFIDKPIKVPPIHLRELKNNDVLSKSKTVRMSFQGVNGTPISYEEYQEILRILKEEKGFDISLLPNIEPIIGLDESIILNDERDVEIHLVEPLLKLLGYSTNDYIRQMPIRMGRGVRYYPDYAFFANLKRGEETAKWVLETKYSIRGDKDFREAFYQARSYAMRLYCSNFVLASKEGIWLFCSDKKNNFNFDSYKKYSWNELKHSDNFHNLLQVVGIEYINKTIRKK